MAYEEIAYQALMGQAPRQIPHWEFLGCPAAETYITGIDYFQHPRECRLRLAEMYPKLNVEIPETDEPIERMDFGGEGETVGTDERGRRVVRWAGATTHFRDPNPRFRTVEDVFNFSPLAEPDWTETDVVTSWDFTSEETLYQHFRKQFPAEWGDKAPEGSTASVYFYQTMFMWPLLAFGWELFLASCLDPRFERVMDEFAELNRRLFRAFARLPINFVQCHDDIVNTRGPVCSPKWMHKYIFPRYEEFFAIVKDAGKEVTFVSDGRMDVYMDDVFACGARGLLGEPYTDYKAIARKHPDCYLTGEGDTRVLSRNNPDEIRNMVESMVETAQMTGGYFMRIGNEFTWSTPPEAVKLYLDLSHELANR